MRRSPFHIALAACLPLLATGCASTTSFPGWDQPDYLERATSNSHADLEVTVATLSAAESEKVYGVPLARRKIQPVWIEVENRGSATYWLAYPGTDPNFYPPSEAAEAMVIDDPARALATLTPRFEALAFRNPILPGEKVSGFVLTQLHEAVKFVQIDLIADGESQSFSFFTVVPGLRVDYQSTATARDRLLTEQPVTDYTDDEAFQEALRSLPCCATNKRGTKNGDPLNLVVIGSVADAFPALIRRGWTPTEVTWFGSVMRMVQSALAGDRYPYAPISNLYLYGRPQDIALQKARDNIHQRNHLRLWRSAMTYHGKPVWVGQISRDIGSRLTIHSPTFTTHKIDPDVDEASTALVEDMAYSQNLRAVGYVSGVGAAPRSDPRRNLTTDPYYTDGRRTVLVFDEHPTPLAEIAILPWEGGPDGFVRQAIEGGAP
jgi:hypothetical protein